MSPRQPMTFRGQATKAAGLFALAGLAGTAVAASAARAELPKITVSARDSGFATADGRPFVPFGVNYFRPGTGWAPQVWKRFDPEATRQDFQRLRELGGNCVRVFLTYGSFLTEPDRVTPAGLEKLDQFLALAAEAGIYVHPTGPDHWEGLPDWARGDRIAGERVLQALERFWRQVASRYRGRGVLFAYDLLNEPAVGWDTPEMRARWQQWLTGHYDSPEAVSRAWGWPLTNCTPGSVAVPKAAEGGRAVEDYQRFREAVAEAWTRRQVAAIKSGDPQALVTVGLIQWSVPLVLGDAAQYSGFRPEGQARYLDFMEVHFYPLARGAYDYSTPELERRNLAYLAGVVAEVARPGKPVVLAEFGWHGGNQPDPEEGGRYSGTEDQQARWCRRVVESTRGLAQGWLNWGFHDHPEARDVTRRTGLLTATGEIKAWGREFQALAQRLSAPGSAARIPGPALDWGACLADRAARERALDAWTEALPLPGP